MKNFLNPILSVLSGLLLAFAWPTNGFAGLLFIAFIPLFIAHYRLNKTAVKAVKWKVFLHAYLTFFIWNIVTTGWLYYSSAFGMWFAVLVNSLLMALVFLVYHLVSKKVSRFTSSSFFIAIWLSFEYLHLHWDFSWPWLQLGNGFSESVSWIQWYEFTGVFGGSLWVLVVNTLLYNAWLQYSSRKENSVSTKGITIRYGIPALLIIALPISLSHFLSINSLTNEVEGTEVVILQPNIDPYSEKYDISNSQMAENLMTLAVDSITANTKLIIAPETTLASGMRLTGINRNPALNRIKRFLFDYPNTYYLGGVSLGDSFKNKDKATSQTNYIKNGDFYYNDYNSAVFMNSTNPVELYHKSKLVVGVENFPYKNVLQPILGDVMLDLGGTVATKTTQEDREVFITRDSLKVAPIICYESVYGEYVTGYVNNGAQFLSIITNDGWWQNTQGHKQHLSLARLRAIETRKWIARSANTGISAVINDYGKIITTLGYEKKGALKGTIYPNNKITFYVKHGDFIARVSVFLMLGIFLFSFTRRGVMKRK